MVCLHCGAKTHVSNSRLQKRSQRVWRRRHCINCGSTFTTEETALYGAAWRVQGQDDRLKPFSRDKLFLSLYKSCQHRPNALEDASDLADTVIRKLTEMVEDSRLWAGTISQVSLVALSRFDKAASVHYQAFHR
jgi:transcriptional regulator NrdR family protein